MIPPRRATVDATRELSAGKPRGELQRPVNRFNLLAEVADEVEAFLEAGDIENSPAADVLRVWEWNLLAL